MRPVSSAFLRAIRGSHGAFSVARVLTSYQEGTNPTGTDLAGLDGSVTADAQATTRGRATLTVSGNGQYPESPAGLLTPYGNEIWLARAVTFGNGATEQVSLGFYRITEVEQDDAPNGPIRIIALDRMSAIAEARLESPRQFTAGTSVEAIFTDLVHEVYPSATILFDWSAASDLLLVDAVADQDRHGFLRDIAVARGKVMFWDYAGKLRVQDPPNRTAPVFEVNYGRDGVLLKLSRRLSRDGVYNVVVATGERASSDVAPVRAVARDMNTASPTYYFGRFGPVPRFFSSNFITTSDQAASAAMKILERAIGLPYEASFESVVNPALEVMDPVAVTYSGRGRREIHVLETITIPLDVETVMTATTREQSTVQIEVDS